MAGATIHILRASLRPKLYRDIEIDSGKSLYDLAEGIVRAFDFDLDHAFGFYSKLTGHYFDSPSKYELFADLEGGESDAKSVKRTKRWPRRSPMSAARCCSCSTTATSGNSRWR